MARQKKIQAAIIMIIALIIVMVGTFAWNSFTQSRVNKVSILTAPDVNLHDDFEGGPNKDVYVENSGTVPIFARIKLTEFLTTVNRGSLVDGHIDAIGNNADDIARAWAAHNAKIDADTQGTDPHKCYIEEMLGSAWPNNANFHDYFTWLFGGDTDANSWVYYKPAPDDKKSRTDEDGNYIDGEVVFDELTGTSPLGDAHLEYLAMMKAELGGRDPSTVSSEEEAEAMEKLGIAKTLATTKVMTMAQWIAEGSKPGSYWVIDEDGWCYWAEPLEGGTATGLLLDKISWSNKDFDSDSDYSINVWLNAVDMQGIMDDDLDINNTGTANAKKLLGTISGQMVTVGDKTFAKKSDGTYVELDAQGVETGAAVIPIGAANEKGFTDYTKVLTVGDKFKLEPDLIWEDGEYEDYDTAGTAPKYNLGTGTDYTIVSAITGRDGNKYLKVEDASENIFYIASIGAATDYAIQPQLGMGPYTIVYVDDVSQLGTKDMKRSDPTVATSDNRYLYHLGNGVYIEVANADSTTQIEDPDDTGKLYYYFMGKILDKTKVKDDSFDTLVQDKLKLELNDKITVTFNESGTPVIAKVTAISAEDGAFFFEELVKGVNGNWYIKLGDVVGGVNTPSDDIGYIGIDAAHATGKYLGQANNIRVWAGPMGIGTGTDITTPPAIFGAGTQADPFRITSKKEMVYISEQVALGKSFAGQYLKVMNNIDLADATVPSDKVYKAIGTSGKEFKGNFNGQSFEITGLNTIAGVSYQGLFGYVGVGGVVENVKLKGATIKGAGYVGGISGYIAGRIANCSVDGTSTIVATGNYSGGIVGLTAANSVVELSHNTAIVTGKRNVGGIVGQHNGKAIDCTNSGEINNPNESYTGGIAASMNTTATVIGCHNTGAVKGGATYTGGVTGNNTGIVQKSSSKGNLSGKQFIGGVAGHNSGTIENCYAWGDITSDLNSQPDLGGVAGYSKGTITKSYHAKGKLEGQHNRVGGIVGNQVGGNLQYCVAYATEIKGIANVGRIIGNSSNGGTFSYCYYRTGLGAGNGGAIYDGVSALADTQTDWANTAKFDFTSIWTWDSTNKVPVLK